MAITIANIDDDTEYVVTLSRSIRLANQIFAPAPPDAP